MDAPERELARIRFVTAHYGELRGLGIVALAVPVLLLMWSSRLWFGPEATWWSTFPAVVVGALALWRVEHIYDSRFGRVRHCPRSSRFFRRIPFLIVGLTFADGALRGHGYPSTLFLAFAAGQAWMAYRHWPWRGHYFVAAGFTAFGAALYSQVTRVPATHDEWLLTLITLSGIGAAIAGLLDHCLLVRTLKPRSDNAAEDVRAESA